MEVDACGWEINVLTNAIGLEKHTSRCREVEGLILDGVGRAKIPVRLRDALARRQDIETLIPLGAKEVPAHLQMSDQAVGLVLGRNRDAADSRVHRIGQSKIDDARFAAEIDRRLGAPVGRLQKPASAPACKNEGEVEGHGADCSGTNGRSERRTWYVPLPETAHQHGLEMRQAVYAAVDWGTSSFRLWLIDRAGGFLQERRSQEGMMAEAKLGFAAVLQSHLDAVGAANDLPVVVCGMAGARAAWGGAV